VPALAHRCPSAIPPGTRADPERDIAAFRLLTSLGGSSVSSPPSPIISGIVLTKPTTNPGRRVGFVKPFGFDGRAAPSNGVDALAVRTSCALGQRCATAISMVGASGGRVLAALSVDGLRKAVTSSSSLKELVCFGFCSCSSFSLNTRFHLLLKRALDDSRESSAIFAAGEEEPLAITPLPPVVPPHGVPTEELLLFPSEFARVLKECVCV
jgi:hypothetical protein